MREVVSNPAIATWRATLTDPEKRRLNYPKAVLARYKARAKAKAVPAEDKPLSPFAKERKANIELQEELHRLKRHGDGNAFTKDDSPKDIASTIIGAFDGLSNKTAKVEAITRELSAWVRKQKIPRSE